jgi:hypothetical protein
MHSKRRPELNEQRQIHRRLIEESSCMYMHRAPVPEPVEEPLPGEHPVPQEEPVPSPNPQHSSASFHLNA